MKYAVVLLLGAVACAGAAEELYTTYWGTVDVDEVLSNDRLLKTYVDCVMERGKCTPDGIKLKKYLPAAIQDECAKCNDQQRKQAFKVIKFFIKKKPDYWKELDAKFDPTGYFYKKYEKELTE